MTVKLVALVPVIVLAAIVLVKVTNLLVTHNMFFCFIKYFAKESFQYWLDLNWMITTSGTFNTTYKVLMKEITFYQCIHYTDPVSL